MFKKNKESDGIIRSVAVAYLILALHLLLVAGLGLVVLFFRGVTQYMFWIVILGILVISASCYIFYRRIKARGQSLGEAVNSPTFAGRPVEVNFLGGFASIKLGNPTPPPALEGPVNMHPQLDNQDAGHIQELTELARLLEKNLITREEFNKAKQQLIR